MTEIIIGTAGKSGSDWSTSTFGIKFNQSERDRVFQPQWSEVELRLEGEPETDSVALTPSFWNDTCREIRSQSIRDWLQKNNLVPWPYGSPPKLPILVAGNGTVQVQLPGGHH